MFTILDWTPSFDRSSHKAGRLTISYGLAKSTKMVESVLFCSLLFSCSCVSKDHVCIRSNSSETTLCLWENISQQQSFYQNFAEDLTCSTQQSYSPVEATEFFAHLFMKWNKNTMSPILRHILSGQNLVEKVGDESGTSLNVFRP